ncbi:MAG: YkgJ family cysteine cluster protein [Desulfobacterales bacterium]
MDDDSRNHALEQVLHIYDDFAATLDVACTRRCADCCTRNVTMTTLEGIRIYRYLSTEGRLDCLDRIGRDEHQHRFRPAVSTNGLAALCAMGEDPPDEGTITPGAPCPFLSDDLCMIYPARPFGCRCFFSRQDCRKTGFADIDPYVVTVNTVFLQLIEHIDTGGLFGNLSDMMTHLASAHNRHVNAMAHDLKPGGFLITNRPIPVLLVPPEHRGRIESMLSRLRNIRMPQAIH